MWEKGKLSKKVVGGDKQGKINVIVDTSKKLWHKRLGHMSEKGLEILC